MFLTKTRLFLIACGYLKNSYYQSKYVPAPEIAEYYKMNTRALMPALVRLTQAGILRSRVGGKEPGFIFSRDPETITMLEVIRALEGDYSFSCCRELTDVVNCECDDKSKCKVYLLMNHTIAIARDKLNNMSLKDYCEK